MRRLGRKLVYALILGFLGLALLDGLCDFALFAFGLTGLDTFLVQERYHTDYDPQLGWSNVPGASVQDLYGPGASIHINSQGFRADHPYSREVPPGRVRLVCSGDSYTLGFGVDDAQTWCAVLQQLEPRLETVNLGQGGYGIDQAYLWYLRDGRQLEPDIHVFAFIGNDFDRMGTGVFHGYGKPVLRVQDGRLQTENVPVPRHRLALHPTYALEQLYRDVRLVKVLRGLAGLLHPAPDPASRGPELCSLADKVFETLQGIHRQQGSALVLVYLPVLLDRDEVSPYRQCARQSADRLGIPLVDLTDPLTVLPNDQWLGLFLKDGHYSVQGNRQVATLLLQKLKAIPETAARLQGQRR